MRQLTVAKRRVGSISAAPSSGERSSAPRKRRELRPVKKVRLVDNFVCTLFFVELFLVLRTELSFAEINYYLVDYAGELERYGIVFTYRRSGVFPNVEHFICRNAERNGSGQFAVGNFFSVLRHRDKTAFPYAAAIIFKIKRDGVFARRQWIFRGYGGPIDADEVVMEDRSAL